MQDRRRYLEIQGLLVIEVLIQTRKKLMRSNYYPYQFICSILQYCPILSVLYSSTDACSFLIDSKIHPIFSDWRPSSAIVKIQKLKSTSKTDGVAISSILLPTRTFSVSLNPSKFTNSQWSSFNASTWTDLALLQGAAVEQAFPVVALMPLLLWLQPFLESHWLLQPLHLLATATRIRTLGDCLHHFCRKYTSLPSLHLRTRSSS